MKHYRIGDAYYGIVPKKKFIKNHDTIMSRYYSDPKAKPQELDRLIDIIQADPRYLEKPIDRAVVHLRVGDVLENTPYPAEAYLKKDIKYKSGRVYVRCQKYYEGFLDDIGDREVVFIFASHLAKMTMKTTRYIQGIKKVFDNNVTQRCNHHPDDDLFYAINSTTYLPAAGGYSRIIYDVHKKIGVNTLGKRPIGCPSPSRWAD